MTVNHVYWIPLIPLAVFLLLGLFYNKIRPAVSGWIGVGGIFAAALLSFYTAYQYFFVVGKTDGIYPALQDKFLWMSFTDKLQIDMGVLVDPISVMMLVVVSFISLMVHIYSRGYMKDDKGYTKFFAFLSLFTFSMLGLVLSTNLFQIYIFWELVGVSSFLLIGFYYTKTSAIAAAKKAFIVTRFADFGFLLGILIMGYYTGTFDFETLNSHEGPAIAGNVSQTFLGFSVLAWGLVLIFMGGAGKSAMFPLHIWLPDAMEGPTPVSALIHAATMVVAGVYLVARLFPVYYFVENGWVLEIVAWVGAVSALFAAIIALTQTDIKRVLAFSTMSQIGYMMLALGVSGYDGHEGVGFTSSLFHLFTHAAFKALLFLCAGSVIHAVHSNEMGKMGQLRKYMPVTHLTFLIAALAISGFPPLAGFWSKDEILLAAFEHHKAVYYIGLCVAVLTAFYMFRLYYSIFWGAEKSYKHVPKESPGSMTGPLVVLAVLSISVGWVPFSEWISADRAGFASHLNIPLAAVATVAGLTGWIMALLFYKKSSTLPDRFSALMGKTFVWAQNKFYIDELYFFITRKILFKGVSATAARIDKKYVDGTMVGIGNGTVWVSEKIKKLQSGKIQDYAFAFVSGVVILAIVFIYLFKA